jgi:hypothetical protein
MKCKFCGCSERRPCQLVAVKDVPDRDAYILAGGQIAIVPKDAQTFLVPCAWLVDNVCSNPICVEKAYLESRDLETAIAIQGLLEMGLVELSDDDDPQLLLTDAGRIESVRMRRTA